MRSPALIEAATGRWARRTLMLAAYFTLFPLLLVMLPAMIVVSLAVDAWRGTNRAATRGILFLAYYFACEVAGVCAAFWTWITHWGRPREHYLERNFRLQCWWASALFAGAQRLFSLRVRWEGEAALQPGPILLFMRHASLVDSLLPAAFVSSRFGVRLRYVMKRELLWDPCLDIVGQRMPNAFVRRGSGDAAREIEAVRTLGENLGPRDGVLIYPEGTRFTPDKRERAIERLRESGDGPATENAIALQHLLPPRPGGPLALIDAGETDVVFAAHVGFDGIATAGDVFGGTLIGREIALHYRRVPYAQIPKGREERAAWLREQWLQVDEWVGRNRA